MQAIVTKFHGPTDTRGSRISAKCEAGKLMLSWEHALNSEQNHDRAALALATKLGWTEDNEYEPMYRGGMPDNTGNVYVFAAPYAKVEQEKDDRTPAQKRFEAQREANEQRKEQ